MQERWEAEQRLWIKGAASGVEPLSTCLPDRILWPPRYCTWSYDLGRVTCGSSTQWAGMQ